MNKRPSLRQRFALTREAVRGIWQGPIYSSDPNLREFFGSAVTTAGVTVSEGTALTVAAVWNAVNCISGDIAALPLNMYRRFDGGKEKFLSNPLHRMVHDQPNPEMTSINWRRTVQAHALTWGNGYSEIVRDGSGRPSQLWPITPDRVTPYRRGIDAALEYRIVNRDGSDAFVPAEDMLHVHGLGFDGIQGYSVIAKARESIGLGMAAERFGESLYGNGLAIGGVITFQGAKPPELSDQNYIASLNSRHQGVERAHKLLALYNGAKYERMNIPPNDAQFLETRTFQLAEVARWFNLPPHKIGDLHRATFSNIEQQTIDYYTGCLLPWLKTWEQELFQKLVPSSERNIQFFEHVVDGLLRGDSQMRADSFSKRFSTASMTPNEIRDAENLNPLTGGDISFVPLNTIPLNKVEAWFDADIDEKKAKAEQARRPPSTPVAPASPSPDPNKAREIELLTEGRDTARRCAQEAEDAKDIIAADLVKAQVELAHARSQWDAERTVSDRSLSDADDRIDTLTLALQGQTAEAVRAFKQVDEQTAEIERLTSQATSLGTDLATATRDLSASVERAALLDADYQRVCGEKTILEAAAVSAGMTIVALEAERAELKSQTEGLSLDVVTSQRETTHARERIAALEAEAERSVIARASEDEAHLATVTELRASVEALTQQQSATSAALAEATTKIAEVEVAHRFDRGAWEADVQRLTDARTQDDAEQQATVSDLRGQIDAVTRELATTATTLTETQARLETSERTRDAERAESAAAVAQATEARTQADAINAATVTELRNQMAAVAQELATSTAALLDAKTTIGALEATRETDRAAVTTAEADITRHVSLIDQVQTRLAESQRAVLGVVTVVLRDLITRESDRARKAQATPEKLNKWIESFYPMHEDFCRAALRPSVRALLVTSGTDLDADRLLDRIIPTFIGESTRQLRAVVMDADQETLGPALERVFRRWETERADAVAARILKEAS